MIVVQTDKKSHAIMVCMTLFLSDTDPDAEESVISRSTGEYYDMLRGSLPDKLFSRQQKS